MRVLLLDTAFAAAPIYDFLVEDGHDVWVMGNRPTDLLAKKARGNWIEQDYSQIAAVEHHIARLGVQSVVPGCTDVSIKTCSHLNVASELRDGVETNHILSNKQLFRSLCKAIDLPAPQVKDESEFPMPGQFICKPIDAFSGRGITVFDGNDLQALRFGLEKARKESQTSVALIETFVAGNLYSYSAFIENERITNAFIVKEGSSANPFAVDTSYVANDIPQESIRVLRKHLEALCAFLKLKDGLLHTQFLLSGSEPFIVEVARRCPGDLYPLLIECSTGFRYAAAYASYFLGQRIHLESADSRHIVRHTVTSDHDVHFEGLMFKQIQAVLGFFPIASIGEQLLARQGNRAGILLCEYPSSSDLMRAYQTFLDRRAYEVGK